MKVRRPTPDAAAVKEFAFALCLIVAAVLLVVGVTQIFAPAGFIVAAGCVVGLAWLLLTGPPKSDEEPR